MMHCRCDWCGEPIDRCREAYVETQINVVTLQETLGGKRERDVEPTRFFHVTRLRSRSEWDRLGLDANLRSEEIGDCCYTRALRAIEGPGSFEAPDAGLEWRLMPVDGPVRSTAAPLRAAHPLDGEMLWRYLSGGPHAAPRQDHEEIGALAYVMVGGSIFANAYVDRGIRTVGDLREAIADRSLLNVKGVGPKRFKAIESALADLLAEAPARTRREDQRPMVPNRTGGE